MATRIAIVLMGKHKPIYDQASASTFPSGFRTVERRDEEAVFDGREDSEGRRRTSAFEGRETSGAIRGAYENLPGPSAQ